jgi:hypothetical protein
VELEKYEARANFHLDAALSPQGKTEARAVVVGIAGVNALLAVAAAIQDLAKAVRERPQA